MYVRPSIRKPICTFPPSIHDQNLIIGGFEVGTQRDHSEPIAQTWSLFLPFGSSLAKEGDMDVALGAQRNHNFLPSHHSGAIPILAFPSSWP